MLSFLSAGDALQTFASIIPPAGLQASLCQQSPDIPNARRMVCNERILRPYTVLSMQNNTIKRMGKCSERTSWLEIILSLQ